MDANDISRLTKILDAKEELRRDRQYIASMITEYTKQLDESLLIKDRLDSQLAALLYEMNCRSKKTSLKIGTAIYWADNPVNYRVSNSCD